MQIKATLVRFVCLLLALSAFGVRAADPQVISIKYNNNAAGNQYGTTELSGVPGARVPFWNNVSNNTTLKSFAAGEIKNNLGAVVSTMTIDIVGATNPAANFAGNVQAGNTNDSKLLAGNVGAAAGGIDINPGPGFTANGGSAVVSNVPFANYTVLAYVRPDGAALNGIQNPTAIYFAISNLTGTVGQKVWAAGEKIGSAQSSPITDQFGRGYTMADTRVQPTNILQVDVGNYVAFTNLTSAAYVDGFILYYGVVGGPASIDGVADTGNVNPRGKIAGFQIVSNSTSAVSSLAAITNVPFLYAGNPAPIGSGIIATQANGTTFPAHLVAGTVYTSSDTSKFTVDAAGNLFAGTTGGEAKLGVTNGAAGVQINVTNLAPVNSSHIRLTVAPTNLLIGANGIGNKAQLALAVDFILPNGTTGAAPANVTLALWNGVSFVSSNTGVATVQNAMPNKGEVTPVAAGAVTMWAQFGSVGNVSSNNFLNVSNSAPAAVLGPPSFGVDIVTVNARGQSTYLYSYLAGAPGFRVPYWNTLLLTGGFELTNSLAGMHDRVGASIASTAYVEVIGTNFSTAQGANANDERIIGTYFQVGLPGAVADTLTQERTLAVTNVPYPLYDLYIYLRNENGNGPATRAGRFTVMQYGTNYETRYRRNVQNGNVPDQNTGAGYTEAVPVGNVGKPPFFNEPSDLTEVPRGNYVRFSGLTDTSKVVVKYGVYVDQLFVEQTTPAMQLAGFQIVRSTANVQATNLYADITTNVMRLGDPNTTAAGLIRADFNDGTFGGGVQIPEVFQFESLDTNIFTVNNTNGLMLSISNGVGRLKVSFTNSVTPTPIYGTSYVLVLPATKVRITGFTPANLLVGVGGAAESRTASLQADFTNGVVENTFYITNVISFANLTNVNVTGYNYHQYSTTSNTIVSVGISNGLVTALSAGTFDLRGSLGLTNGTTNGSVTAYSHPVNGPDSFGVDIINLVTNDPATIVFSQFAQLSGITGQRMAYWNPLIVTNEFPFTNNAGSAVPAIVHGALGTVRDRKGTVLAGATVDFNAIGNGSGASQGATTNEDRIITTFIDAGAAAGYSTAQMETNLTVTGVPYAVYDVYAYFQNDSGAGAAQLRAGHVTVAETGETRWRMNSTTLAGSANNNIPNPINGNGYVEAVPIITNGSIPNAVTPFTLGMDATNSVPRGNYVRFMGLTNSTMTVNWGADDTTTVPGTDAGIRRIRLAGFQIIRNLQTVLVTNIFVSSPSPVPSLLPGNPIGTPITVSADFNDGTKNVNVTSQSKFTSLDTGKFTVTAAGVVSPVGPGNGTLQITFTNLATTTPLTNNTVINVGTPTSAKMSVANRVLSIGHVNAQSNTTATLFSASFNNGSNNVNVSSFAGISWSSGSGNISVGGNTVTALSTGLFNLTATYATLVTTSNNIGIVINYNTNLSGGSGNGIIGYWPLNEGTGHFLNEFTGTQPVGQGTLLLDGGDGTLGGINGPTTSPWVTDPSNQWPGKVLGFPTLNGGSGAFGFLGSQVIPALSPTNALTMTIWHKPTVDNGNQFTILGARNQTNGAFAPQNDSFKLGANRVEIAANNATVTVMAFTVEAATNNWLLHTAVKDGTNYYYYRNGVLTASNNAPVYGPSPLPMPLYIGADGWNGAANIGISLQGGVPGYYTDAALWSRPLAPTELLAIYQNGTNGIRMSSLLAPVTLSAKASGTNVTLSWPYTAFGWMLRSNNVATGPVTNWANITPSAASLTFGATNISYTLPASAAQSYFILQQQ